MCAMKVQAGLKQGHTVSWVLASTYIPAQLSSRGQYELGVDQDSRKPISKLGPSVMPWVEKVEFRKTCFREQSNKSRSYARESQA